MLHFALDSPDFLRAMLPRLGICTDEEQESDHEQVLDNVSFEGIANYIKTEKCMINCGV